MESLFGTNNNSNTAKVATGIANAAIGAGVGYIVSHIFKIMTPVAGAIFGGVVCVASYILDPILDRLFNDSTIEKIVKVALNLFLSILAGFLFVALCGFTITIKSALILSGAIVVTMIVVRYALAQMANCANEAKKKQHGWT